MLFRTLCIFTTLALATTSGSVPTTPEHRMPGGASPLKGGSALGANPEIVPVTDPGLLLGSVGSHTGSLVRRAMPFPRYLAIRAQHDEDYVSNVGMPPKPDVPPPPAYPEFPSQPMANSPSSHQPPPPPTGPQNATHANKKGEPKTKNVQRIKSKGKSSENVKGKSS